MEEIRPAVTSPQVDLGNFAACLSVRISGNKLPYVYFWLPMDKATLLERINQVKAKQNFLLRLAEQPNLGILQLDVSQAISELEDLLEDCANTFPAE